MSLYNGHNGRYGHEFGSLNKTLHQQQNMRGGLRVYKIVILGDGGVGKSGMFKVVV